MTTTETRLAAIRALLAAHDTERTHWDGCEGEHLTCAARWLERRVERLEAALHEIGRTGVHQTFGWTDAELVRHYRKLAKTALDTDGAR